MRVMLKAQMPVETGNEAIRSGTLGATVQAILEELKPEAVYFTDSGGCRTAYLFLQIADSSDIPRIAEPWFLAFNAHVELHPVMTPEDLAAAMPHLEAAVRKY